MKRTIRFFLNDRFNRKYIETNLFASNQNTHEIHSYVDDYFKHSFSFIDKETDEYWFLLLKLLDNLKFSLSEALTLMRNGGAQQSLSILRLSLEELVVIGSVVIGEADIQEFAKGDLKPTKYISKIKKIWPSIGPLYGNLTTGSVHLCWEVLGSNVRPAKGGQFITPLPRYDYFSSVLVIMSFLYYSKISYQLCSIACLVRSKISEEDVNPKQIDDFFIPRIDELSVDLQEKGKSISAGCK